MTRKLEVSKEEVYRSWQLVKSSGGCSGSDGRKISDVESNLEDELYKVWNRMGSGSYMAQPVQLVTIPKVNGGNRTLGIPTVTDRVAQQVVKRRLEPLLESHFHGSSYGYRPGRSAEMALTEVRNRSYKAKWIIDLDLKSYFDTIDHKKLLEMLSGYTEDRVTLLYTERFLKASGINESGEEVPRERGTPQGGVISPLLANLYLHEAFDVWMEEKMSVRFTRYADDIIVHCVTREQAHYVLDVIRRRLGRYGLEVNEEKTQIVYVGGGKRRGYPRKFIFLGYTFKHRQWQDKVVFAPAFGTEALKVLKQKMRCWRVGSMVHLEIGAIAERHNSVIRGWIVYYGMFWASALYKLAKSIDNLIAKWLKRKYKLSWAKAWKRLKELQKQSPRLFCHWYMIKERTTRAV